MNNQNISDDLHPEDVALARDFADEYRNSEYAPDRTVAVARVLAALLPSPPRPTMADMPYEERAACRWMQCDVEGEDARAVIFNPCREDGGASVLWPGGFIEQIGWGVVTPRPDLPRMTYLDTPEAVPPNTLAVGSLWVGVEALTRACEESGRDQIAVSGYDGYVSVWDNDAEWWEGSVPPRAAPYTIIYAGKEADQ